MKHPLLLCFLFFFNFALIAQNHADCDSALVICDKKPLILPMFGPGNDPSELDNAPCFLGFSDLEFSSAWIRWQVAQSGTLWFIIRPFNPLNDIDFVVYRLPTGDCTEKVSVRCMAAGDVSPISPCMGPTGLLPSVTDINNPPGCPPGTDNFLRALDMLVGEHYVLAINNFSSNSDTVSVEFCGTALLGCETEMCAVLDADEPNSTPDLSVDLIFPNPTSVDNGANIQINSFRSQAVSIRITDMQSLAMKQVSQELSEGTNAVPLQTFNFPAGVYFVTVMSEKTMLTKRLVITN